MTARESARASLETHLRRANPDADIQVKRMTRGGREILLASAPEAIAISPRWEGYAVEFRKLNTAALIPGSPQYNDHSAKLKRNARLRRNASVRSMWRQGGWGLPVETEIEVDFIYEED
jgi:hypothetical protein